MAESIARRADIHRPDATSLAPNHPSTVMPASPNRHARTCSGHLSPSIRDRSPTPSPAPAGRHPATGGRPDGDARNKSGHDVGTSPGMTLCVRRRELSQFDATTGTADDGWNSFPFPWVSRKRGRNATHTYRELSQSICCGTTGLQRAAVPPSSPSRTATIPVGATLVVAVRRGKAPFPGGCESRPATVAPAGSNRSG